MDTLVIFERLGVALAIGVLIGTERGWSERQGAAGSRVAGIRTFAISGLLGGLWMLLGDVVGPVLLGVAFAAFAAVITVVRIRATAATGDFGATTVVAAMITFALGALAAAGELAVAAASAVVTTLLLGAKEPLHALLRRIDYDELLAVLKLLAMTLVLLPVLPDQGYGPWGVFNPFDMWLMVILIAGISFLGYVAVRIAGSRLGVPLAGLLGGLASSTAVALSFARRGRGDAGRARLFGLGIAIASVTMLPRTLAVAAVINIEMAMAMAWPLGAATLAGAAVAGLFWHRPPGTPDETLPRLSNPFEFLPALQFGLLLAAVLFIAEALRQWLGDTGLVAVAAISGLADVDAINLAISHMAPEQVTVALGASVVLLAALVNTLVKVALSLIFGGVAVALPATAILGASIAAGGIAWWFS